MRISSDKENLHIEISVPLVITGSYTYGEGKWKAPGVCILINERMCEYMLCYTQYLDYKDDLQATQPIVYFDSEKEAMKIADEFGLSVMYSS